ncbi:MAG: hypothetical protein ABIG95_03790 [Candidatus Woesearchaeota archaeon]
MCKVGVYLLVIILFAGICHASISGSIYDLSLDKVGNVVVVVNSSPNQRFVSKGGDYEFELPVGHYKIEANLSNGNFTVAHAEEFLDVVDDGDYLLDLFLFPSFEEEEALIDDAEIDVPFADARTTNYLLVGVLVLLGVAVLLLLRRPGKKIVVEGSDDLQKVMSIIRAEGGRTTQKEIRKHMPYSEAKVSLIIAELEAKELVEKIKKGRGNIIILKK